MAALLYSTNCSLDGYITDEQGSFDFSDPSPDQHQFINDRMRTVGTHLYGRRLYEVMRVWEDFDPAELSPVEADFQEIWRATDKVVYSATLDEVPTPRTTLERSFDPQTVREFARTAEADVLVGGAMLAAEALRAGIVDELSLYVAPCLLGGGAKALPDGVRQQLRLVDTRRFDNGVVVVTYLRA
ncbi:dihydrofolate reductase family protein [Agromyces mediolanus]|uniref:Deaminase n=1 Tax=Agromyces mediolanus TaxID=41986 RepID=A0A918FHK6_AGRME|nr:dihydrofolate reductase family protein [Agromyces mediolanus]GGR38137.1 deaminase [Agromyces mediolanus]GLJ71720.1 deaminase [Agromyces mediolanus]